MALSLLSLVSLKVFVIISLILSIRRNFEERVRHTKFAQDNESKSCYGVVRGVHL